MKLSAISLWTESSIWIQKHSKANKATTGREEVDGNHEVTSRTKLSSWTLSMISKYLSENGSSDVCRFLRLPSPCSS